MLVIRKTKSVKNTLEIKYSFTNAKLEQYTSRSLAYMQAQRFFCRTLHQRIQVNTGNRPVSDPKVAGVATPGCVAAAFSQRHQEMLRLQTL
tara:strand:+ start:17309 stop:17581 length:273 start_codon:yes stop_codon:yes gene_type:complete